MFEVRVIRDGEGTEALGHLVATARTARAAEALAEQHAGHYFYGVAVLNTRTGAISW